MLFQWSGKQAFRESPTLIFRDETTITFCCGSPCRLLLCSPLVCADDIYMGGLYGKEPLTRLTLHSLCNMYICNLSYFPFEFLKQRLRF